MVKEITIKNTKNDILDAYQQALKEIKIIKEQSAKEIQNINKKKTVVAKATEASPDGLVANISKVKVSVSKSLDDLCSELVREQERLSNLQNAINIQQAVLKDTYDIQTELDSMDAIILAHKTMKQDFNQEIAASRLLWEQEKSAQERILKEEKELLEKNRAREKDEFTYNLKKTRQADVDSYQLKKVKLERELSERKESFEKEIIEREQTVSEQEVEFKRLKLESESFSKLLEKSIKEANDKTKQELTKQYEYLANLKDKETHGKLALHEQTNKSLLDKISEQKALIDQLSDKSNFANTQVQDIALKAIEGASKMRIIENGSGRKEVDA